MEGRSHVLRNILYQEIYPNRVCTSLCEIIIPEERILRKLVMSMTTRMTTRMTTFRERSINRIEQWRRTVFSSLVGTESTKRMTII